MAAGDVSHVRDSAGFHEVVEQIIAGFIDVGIDVWFRVYDWHLKWQQPLQIGRDTSGRYTMAVMATTLVMRPDVPPNFVSIPYDNK